MGQGTATIVAESVRLHKEPGSKDVIAYLLKNERVHILAPPPPGHQLRWWKVETDRVRSTDNRIGWVAEGDGKAVWLKVDPLHEETDHPDPILEPRRPPQSLPDQDDMATPIMPLILIGIAVAVGLLAWIFH